MTLFERFVMEQVNKGHSIIGLYPPTDKEVRMEYEKWKGEALK